MWEHLKQPIQNITQDILDEFFLNLPYDLKKCQILEIMKKNNILQIICTHSDKIYVLSILQTYFTQCTLEVKKLIYF